MRILHVVHTPRYSGAEMLVVSLARHHKQMGHASCVVSLNPFEEDFKPVIEQQRQNNIEWITPEQSLGKLARVAFIRKAMKNFSADVTFAHSVIPAAYARLTCSKNVFTVLHDASENDYASPYFAVSEKLLQYRSTGVIAVSEVACKFYNEKFPYPSIRHIPNGISIADTRVDISQRSGLRKSLGFADSDFVAIQIGRVNSIKQQHLSLQAITPIIRNNCAVHLVLAGLIEDVAYLDGLKHLVVSGGLERNIHFLGPRNDVAELLCAADLFLMPSLREAHSVAMIEALASGLPIVASSIPSFMYANNFDGITLLEPKNTMLFTSEISSFLKLRERYSRNLRGFDITDTANAYIDFAAQCTS